MTRDEAIEYETAAMQKILDNHFARTIHNMYGGIEEFLKSIRSFWQTGRANNREMKRYISLFSIQMENVVVRPRIDGKRLSIANDVKVGINGYRFVGKVDRNKFHHKSYIMISEEHAIEIMSDRTILDVESDRYTDDDRDRIYGFAEKIRNIREARKCVKDEGRETDMKDKRKTFEVTLEDGTRLRVQKTRVVNNNYEKDRERMMKRGKIDGNRVRCEWAMKKIDHIRWITDGDFNRRNPCSLQTLMYYGDRKFKRMYNDEHWTEREMMDLDEVFYLTEGLYTDETIPRNYYTEKQ